MDWIWSVGAIETLTVFDVADSRGEFLEYLAYLHKQGLRPTRDAWLREAAHRLLGLDSADARPPKSLDQAWTLDRRRLLVVLTWPYTYGDLAPRFPVPGDPPDIESGISGLYGRTYQQLWADIRENMKSLEWLAQWRGDWGVLAERWGLARDVLWESAHLGLVVTHNGQSVNADVVDAFRSDSRSMARRAREGFVLTWWDLVAIAECANFSFEPFDNSEAMPKRSHAANGRYLWDRPDLVERIGRAARVERVEADMRPRVDAELEARTSEEIAPAELHRRITADGRITPPPVGSKYRALFEHLDAIDFADKRVTVRLSRNQLDELTSRADFDAARTLRGSRGRPGLPTAATRPGWWYGPWNPDVSDWATSWSTTTESSWSSAIGKKSHTRAWMAAGLRAKPIIKPGNKTVVAVHFEPVNGREDWWPWRNALRNGSYHQRVQR